MSVCFTRRDPNKPSRRPGAWGRLNPRTIVDRSAFRVRRGHVRSAGRRNLLPIAGAPGSTGLPGRPAAERLPQASESTAECDQSWSESKALRPYLIVILLACRRDPPGASLKLG